jgi:trans-aconitate 2-methyltransferase
VATWNPQKYLQYADERALPFRHLIAAVDDLEPTSIVDLGCGPGGFTATLLAKWPSARIVGVDSSPQMIERATKRTVPSRLTFELCDLTTWIAPCQIDLVIANAVLHWIEDHASLLDHLADQLADSGVLAFQVPANHDAPSHRLLRDICVSRRWRSKLAGHPRTGVREAKWYIDTLSHMGLAVTAWQTTYFHRLTGDDPVLEWVRGTTLRPILDRLDGEEQDELVAQYGAALRAAYPSHGGVTSFPFTRTFVIARKNTTGVDARAEARVLA